MSDIYICKYFKIQELVPPRMYNTMVERNKVINMWIPLNREMLMTLDMLREAYGVPVTINNWHSGGNRTASGLRLHDSNEYSLTSAHSFGHGFDLIFAGIPASKIREDMRDAGCFEPGFKERAKSFTPKDRGFIFRFINRVENTLNGKQITWFHMDQGNHMDNGAIRSLDI